MMKIMDESTLFFYRVFLSKFSLKALYISWIFYSNVCEECEKSVFIQTGYSGDSASWVERVAS